jgi:hypothetical protein
MEDYSTVGVTGGSAPIGKNGVTQRNDGPNVSGPPMKKPESKGTMARDQGALQPKSAS